MLRNSSNSSKKSNGFETSNTRVSNTKKKQVAPAKHWCFTHCNYTTEDISMWKKLSENADVVLLVFQTELAPTTGTPHLQGTMSFAQKVRPMNYVSSKVPSWSVRKAGLMENIRYCTKTEEQQPEPFVRFYYGYEPPEVIRTINPDKWWQKEIISILSAEADDRTIHWYWGVGNIGKTSMAKYCAVHHGAIPCSGKGADMRNAIVQYKATNWKCPKVVIVPIPRSFNHEYLSYEGIEQVKDMFFYSGKYEGGVVCGNPPHLIVLSNQEPDRSQLSMDRWHIVQID